jgi:hypothetical protein
MKTPDRFVRRFFSVILGPLVILLSLAGVGCRTAVSSSDSISAQDSRVLINWLCWARAPKAIKRDHPGLPYEICDELLSRREVDLLVASLDNMSDEESRTLLVSRVLYQIDDDRIYKAFAARLDDKETEESYYVANYLAKRGNTAALATLNRHYFSYPVSSWQWSYTAALFGLYKYKPAATNLVESLDAASLNLSSAACDALHAMYPSSPAHFATSTEARDYYSSRVAE